MTAPIVSRRCEVEVFEKSSGLMKDRGAGIVFQQEVAEFLTRYGVAPPESVVVPVRTRRYLEADGSVAQEGPMPQAMTSWDVLYRKLRAAFGDDHYHAGVRLVLRPLDRTLTDGEANVLRDKVYVALHEGGVDEWAAAAS